MADGSEAVRIELHGRVAALTRRLATPPEQIAGELGAIRAAARRAGLHPAVTVTHLLDAALANRQGTSLVRAWLGVLDEALDCRRSDPLACDAYAAACSVRLAG